MLHFVKNAPEFLYEVKNVEKVFRKQEKSKLHCML